MEKDQAWQIIVQACAQVSTTLQQHQIIQQALMTLRPESEPRVSEPKKE